jgi:hypothetical protein
VVPAAPSIFYGRDEYVNLVTTALVSDEASHVAYAIMGYAGMGKSTIARAVLNNRSVVSYFGNSRLWISCDLFPTASSLLQHLCHCFSIPLELESERRTTDIILSIMIPLLSSGEPSPRLIVFDNLETLWWPIETQTAIEEVLAKLMEIPRLTLLITMRGMEPPLGPRWRIFPILQPLSLEYARMTYQAISAKF